MENLWKTFSFEIGSLALLGCVVTVLVLVLRDRRREGQAVESTERYRAAEKQAVESIAERYRAAGALDGPLSRPPVGGCTSFEVMMRAKRSPTDCPCPVCLGATGEHVPGCTVPELLDRPARHLPPTGYHVGASSRLTCDECSAQDYRHERTCSRLADGQPED